MYHYMKKLKNFPIGAIGTSLGFMTLANVWAIHSVTIVKPLAIIFALIAMTLMLAKIIIFPKKAFTELKDPIVGAFYPTIDMAGFVLASYLLPYSPTIAKAIWLIGIVVHLSIFVFFFLLRFKSFKLRDMIPSWNVVLVGVCVAGVVSSGFGFPRIANALTYLGLFLYIPFYPFMLYRVYVHEHKIEPRAAATIGILAAPSSLVLASYLTTSTMHSRIILWYLIITSLLNIILVFIAMPRFIKNGFNPGYAAFTFPVAISMLAMWKVNVLFGKYNDDYAKFFRIASHVELVIGTLIIAYVAINFIILFIKAIKHASSNKEKSKYIKIVK